MAELLPFDAFIVNTEPFPIGRKSHYTFYLAFELEEFKLILVVLKLFLQHIGSNSAFNLFLSTLLNEYSVPLNPSRYAKNLLKDQIRTSQSKWSVFLILFGLAIIASAAALPRDFAVMQATSQDVSHWEVATASFFQRLLLSTIGICLGIMLGEKFALGVPYLNATLSREMRLKQIWLAALVPSVAWGIGIGVVFSFTDPWLMKVLMPEWTDNATRAVEALEHIAPWKYLLSSFSAGVTEELFFRFGLMTLIAWLGVQLTHGRLPIVVVLWSANLLVAFVFGLIHLRNVVALGISVSPGIFFYVVLWNGIAAAVFGWFYWRRGLESAIICHISADIYIKVIVPFLVATIN
ncbi:CPBP family intramembrane glutamic endopeptidase [Bythopirellula goksoeyrii]|uniref:CPBP family intramembrane glutamic endopeptidase n=1 Tax=Bythopirellula goksoeyrii TaxID=1400387 RepID=UPI00143CFC80|nr:CPBP family intramembrane glutamic endopeptidase [Bythopirellula goksoeyrii]